MAELVELLREPTHGAVRVTKLPLWVRSPRGEYWHHPRSAALYPVIVFVDGEPVDTGRLRLAAGAWCGVGLGTAKAGQPQFTDDPPEELRCGTCVGRRLGWLQEQGLVFRPRDHFGLPRWCPGEYDPADPRRCFACGARVQAARGWWASGIARHAPAPELLDRCRPCPRHGWRDVAAAGGLHGRPQDRLACRVYGCGHDCGPHA